MNLELKTVDGSANPYLSLAGVITAGLDGLRGNLDPGEPVDGDPGLLDRPERARRGIVPLPRSLSMALDALSSDSVLLEALGAPLARSYTAVRRGELVALRDLSDDEQARQHLLKY
jgi:glutamine synthetase